MNAGTISAQINVYMSSIINIMDLTAALYFAYQAKVRMVAELRRR